MNQITNNMNLQLTIPQITQLKELIFNEIDRVGGLDLLNDELFHILIAICSEKAPEVL